MKTVKKIGISLMALLLLCGCTLLKAENEITKTRSAIILKMDDELDVKVTREGKDENAFAGMRLVGGDIVKTGSHGSVHIRVDDDKNVVLSKDSSMEITKLESGKLVLTLLNGEFFFDVENKLSEDESMSFVIGSSTMSIRGTSGGGKIGQDENTVFMIYTGLGVVENTHTCDETHECEHVEYSVIPGTKLIVGDSDEENGEVSIQPVTPNDIPETVINYILENDTYHSKMDEQGYNIDTESGEISVSEELLENIVETISQTEEYEQSNPLLGYRQNADGSWTFCQDDYDQEIGPTYYVEPAIQLENHEEEQEKKTFEAAPVLIIHNPTAYICTCCHCTYTDNEASDHQLCPVALSFGIEFHVCSEEHWVCEFCGRCICEVDEMMSCEICGKHCCSDCVNAEGTYCCCDGAICPCCYEDYFNTMWSYCSQEGCNCVITDCCITSGNAYKCAICNKCYCENHSGCMHALSDGNWVCGTCFNSSNVIGCANGSCSNRFISKSYNSDSTYAHRCNQCHSEYCSECSAEFMERAACGEEFCVNCASTMTRCPSCSKLLCSLHCADGNSYACRCSECGLWYCSNCYNLEMGDKCNSCLYGVLYANPNIRNILLYGGLNVSKRKENMTETD